MLMFEHSNNRIGILVLDGGFLVQQPVERDRLARMLTCRQVADFLSIRRWSDEGALKSYRVGSRGDRRYKYRDGLHFLGESR